MIHRPPAAADIGRVAHATCQGQDGQQERQQETGSGLHVSPTRKVLRELTGLRRRDASANQHATGSANAAAGPGGATVILGRGAPTEPRRGPRYATGVPAPDPDDTP